MITYRHADGKVNVYVDGTKTGEIRPVYTKIKTRTISQITGYHYKPTGAAPGETFRDVHAVKCSIEGRL